MLYPVFMPCARSRRVSPWWSRPSSVGSLLIFLLEIIATVVIVVVLVAVDRATTLISLPLVTVIIMHLLVSRWRLLDHRHGLNNGPW